MRADIIVPTYGNEDLTCNCFDSLRKHTTGYRLIWVDNGSGIKSIDNVLPQASLSPLVPLWHSDNLGFVKGTNSGLRLLFEAYDTDSDYIVFLNNDVEVTDGWLNRMIRVCERNPEIGAVGPVTSECSSWQSFKSAKRVCSQFQVPSGFDGIKDTDERARKLAYVYGETSAKCHMLAFFCTVFRSDVFRKIGYLDEDYGIGLGDDDDLCMRIRNAGYELALSMGTYVFHNHRSTFSKLYGDAEIKAMQKERHETYYKKHGERARVK